MCFLMMGLLPCYTAPSTPFMQYYNEAQEAMLRGEYRSAIVNYRKALKINYLDNSSRIGIVNAYLARATYYANQEKNYDAAANDFRSALFYLRIYPAKEQTAENNAGIIASANDNLNQCLKVISFDTTSASRYKKAEELRVVGNLSAAAYEFSRAAQNEKIASDCNIQIANILKLLGNETRSAEYYGNALDLAPGNNVLRMQYARTLDKLGRYDEAVKLYNEALANSKDDQEILWALDRIYLSKLAQTPSDAELNANMGAIKQALGDYDSALSYYGKAEQLNPSNINTRLNVGTLFQQRKEYQKAITAYDSVLTLYPNNTQALLYKAQVFKEMGDAKAAMTLYKKVLSLEPSNSIARAEMGAVIKDTMTPSEYLNYLLANGTESELYEYSYKLHKEKQLNEAIKGYKAVISKNANNADAYINLAVCYAGINDYDNAINTLNTAKNKFPANNLVLQTLKDVQNDNTANQIALASDSYNNKDYKKAIQQYLAINPATEHSLLGVAASYQAMNDFNSAIEYYKKAEQLNPKNAEIPYYIGYLYSEQNNWILAENYLKKAMSLNPQSEAKELLAYVTQSGLASILNEGIDLYEKNNFQGALQKFNEVLKKEVTNAYAYYYRALIYDEQKQLKLAINDYLNVLKNSNNFPIVNYMLAVDYDSLENYKEAFNYYNKFIASYNTDDEYLKYAKSRINELKPYVGG